MNRRGPVVIVDDDPDERQIYQMAFGELDCGNEILFFDGVRQALEYLEREDVYPFLVISDVNMPKLSGFDLRRQMLANARLSKKWMPFIFFSTAADRQTVDDAFNLSVQGFFKKPAVFSDLVATLRNIVGYWQECSSPGNFYHNEPISLFG